MGKARTVFEAARVAEYYGLLYTTYRIHEITDRYAEISMEMLIYKALDKEYEQSELLDFWASFQQSERRKK